MKTIIWDFDGTLGYRSGRWSGAIIEVLRQYYVECDIGLDEIRSTLQGGFPWHQPDVAHTHIETADQWWQMLNPVLVSALEQLDVERSDIGALVSQIRTNYVKPTSWSLFDDVLPGLVQLGEQGWQHVILSNHVPELGNISAHLGLNPFVDRLFNSAQIGYEKPNPMAFRIVLNSLREDCELAVGRSTGPTNRLNERIWMIGDNIEADIHGATNVGLNAILLRKYHPEAHICCQDIWQVVDVLASEP